MRRRAGAEIVDIDTFAGTCRFWYTTPREIDFAAIERAAEDASYELVEIHLSIEGEVLRTGSGFEVRVPETGQRFTVDGATGAGARLHLHTTVADWRRRPPHLTIEAAHLPGAGPPD